MVNQQGRKALGRGLASLLPESDNEINHVIDSSTRSLTNKVVNYVDINAVRPCPTQPRINYDERELRELGESIKEVGVLQPILVRTSGNFYEIIAGERRWRASKLINLKNIPVIVKDCSDKEALQAALIENIQRSDLNSIEEAKAYKQLIDEHKLSQDEVSKSVGKERSTVANFLRLLKLPNNVQHLISEKKITMGHAKTLSGLENDDLITKTAYRIITKNLSVRETENFINSLKNVKSKKVTNIFDEVEDNLRKILQTKVRVKGSQSKGKIVIDYFNKNDFERVYNVLTRG